jgi:hypothetical protein
MTHSQKQIKQTSGQHFIPSPLLTPPLQLTTLKPQADTSMSYRYLHLHLQINQLNISLPSPLPQNSYRNGKIVMITSGELYFFALGTGEYNELVLTELLRCIIASYKDIFKTSSTNVLTEDVLFQNYAATVMIVGEVLKEGLAELTDRGSIARSLIMKLPQIEGLEVKSKGILGSMFST